jgi:serine/threonine protein kinase
MAKFLYENNIKNAIKVYQHGIIHVPERYIDNISLGYMSTAKKDKIGYIIQERLYSMDKFISKFEDVEEVFNRDIDGDYEYFYGIEFRDMLKEKYNMKIGKITSFMSFLVEICHQFNRKIINEILNTILEFYTKSQFNFIKEIVNVIKSLYEQGIKWRDVHPEQFGYNIKGKLKAFDLDDNTVFNTVNYSSKNTIKEHKSNK